MANSFGGDGYTVNVNLLVGELEDLAEGIDDIEEEFAESPNLVKLIASLDLIRDLEASTPAQMIEKLRIALASN